LHPRWAGPLVGWWMTRGEGQPPPWPVDRDLGTLEGFQTRDGLRRAKPDPG